MPKGQNQTEPSSLSHPSEPSVHLSSSILSSVLGLMHTPISSASSGETAHPASTSANADTRPTECTIFPCFVISAPGNQVNEFPQAPQNEEPETKEDEENKAPN